MKLSFLFSFILISSLVILSFLIPDFQIGNLEIKKPDIISDIGFIFKEKESDSVSGKNIMELNFENDNDSVIAAIESEFLVKDFRKDSLGFLAKFFAALRKTEIDGTKTRIAFFGDSMIEGDLISSTLRYKLQKKFGGAGVGFVSAVDNIAGFRKTIYHTSSNNWKKYSILQPAYISKTGISGYVFNPAVISKSKSGDSAISNSLSRVLFKPANDSYDNLSAFDNVKLYYSFSSPENFISVENGSLKRFALEGKNIVNELLINKGNLTNSIQAYFHTSSPVDVYGFSFETEKGVYVDNFSMRGNSGIPLSQMNPEIIKGFNNKFNYNLIVLQYGLNIASPDAKDVNWYKEKMISVINYFRNLIPNAEILILSVNDKSYRKGGVMTTEPVIPKIVEIQKQIAEETGTAFWNLFEAMGGKNSMSRWVKSKPPLANKDYTHFNREGAEKAGTFLYKQLMYHYNKSKNGSNGYESTGKGKNHKK